MISFFRVAAFSLIFIFIIISQVYAQSSYVLPYPSSMPGSFVYNLRLVFEGISRYWYFGDFGHFSYNLKMADKYLVGAKTLFEYKQYLLGYRALKKSNSYFISILPNLVRAEKNGKNTLQKKAVINEASQKHIETLKKMEIDTPNTFNWQPENALPTILEIKKAIEGAIDIRKMFYE